MVVSYAEALGIVNHVGSRSSVTFTRNTERIVVHHAVKRINKTEIRCLKPTPPFDTSAMDGFAVNSEDTRFASPLNPVVFCIKGTMAAGDNPISIEILPTETTPPCVEIVTGAQFPADISDYHFDACVRFEDVHLVSKPDKKVRYIQIVAPVTQNSNRRFAGSDFQKSDVLVPAMMPLRAQHIMALASAGIGHIEVLKQPRIGIWSTGSELICYDSIISGDEQLRDSNGPYLFSALQELGADVDYLGIIRDDPCVFANAIRTELQASEYDLVITTGAVSKGLFDYVRDGIESLGADIQFHGVAIRPGHPVLFATVPGPPEDVGSDEDWHRKALSMACQQSGKTAFFGLPGNPIASAVGLRFFVMPYLRQLAAQPPEKPMSARVRLSNIHHPSGSIPVSRHLDTFRHANLWQTESGLEASMTSDQGPSKIKPWLEANCWIMIPSGHGNVKDGDILPVFPMLASLSL